MQIADHEVTSMMVQKKTVDVHCNSYKTILLAAVLLGTAVDGMAQTAASPAPQWQEQTSSVAGPHEILPAESLGADDLLEVMVSYCPELSHEFRVSSDGDLSLPLLHKPLKVAGLTPSKVAETLQHELVVEGILADPTVSVSVLEYRSRPVSVVGAVNHPLTFQATGKSTLLDAIAKADGLAPGAGNTVILTQLAGVDGSEPKTVKVISVSALLRGSDPELNVKLQGGEEIRIPEASKIFVTGNVRRPGMYPMLGDSETTVLKAITLSEGLDAYSSPNAFIYRRRGTGSERDELKVPLSRMMHNKEPDMALLADDILYIPSNDGKKLTGRILNELAGFGQTAGAGVLIYK